MVRWPGPAPSGPAPSPRRYERVSSPWGFFVFLFVCGFHLFLARTGKKKKKFPGRAMAFNSFNLLPFLFAFGGDREVTRSSRRYCSTGATLGRGGVRARQSQGRGLNNRLKLL